MTNGHPATTPRQPSSISSITPPRQSLDLLASPATASSTFPSFADPTPPSRTAGSTIPIAAKSEAIEMEPVVAGQHRRRTSSLVGGASPNVPGGARAQAGPAADGKRIVEEEDDRGAASTAALLRDDPLRDTSDEDDDDDVRDDEEMGLTSGDRRKRQKKRRRNTRLDQRVARDKGLSTDERKEADRSVIKRSVINVTLILLWYTFSLCISLYNKWMFDADRLNFSFPLFTTSAHMIMQFLLSGLVLFFIPSLRPGAVDGSAHDGNTQGPIMSKMFYLTRIAPCGAATGLDIGLGNTSLKFITLTFYTMCKSSSLAFVLGFAFVFRLEQPTWRLVAIIAAMTAGVVLMVFGEVEFELGGFVLVISAAFFSGFRWALTQILLLRNPATSNPFSSIFFLSPVMFVVLFILAVPVEGFGPLWEGLGSLKDAYGAVLTPLLMMFPGCIAFLMTASEFALLQRTSVVTLSIAGIFKEVVTISAASIVFKDKLTLVNFIGLMVTLLAIVAYNYLKITKMRREAQNDAFGKKLEKDEDAKSIEADATDDEREEESAGLLRRLSDDLSGLVASDAEEEEGKGKARQIN